MDNFAANFMNEESIECIIDGNTYHIKYVDDCNGGLDISFHKIGGPAVIEPKRGIIQWYVEDEHFFNTREYCEACKYDEENTVLWLLKYGEILPNDLKEW